MEQSNQVKRSEEQHRVEKLVIRSVEALNKNWKHTDLKSVFSDTLLYSSGGSLDSMQLVQLVAELEESIELELNQIVTLADEKAMSQKRSPFHSVKTMVNYIDQLLLEQNQTEG